MLAKPTSRTDKLYLISLIIWITVGASAKLISLSCSPYLVCIDLTYHTSVQTNFT